MSTEAPPAVRVVTLEWYEVLNAATIGTRRHVTALAAGKRDDGIFRDPWGAHITGAMGEAAVAKALGRYWDGYVGTNGRGHGDVGPYEVRWRAAHDWDLWVGSKDDDARIFILVTGDGPTFQVHGWLTAAEVKALGVYESRGGRPCWWVTSDLLHPLDTLPGGNET